MFVPVSRSIAAEFAVHGVDGKLLLRLDDKFVKDTLEVTHALHRKKLLRHLDVLKQRHVRSLSVSV